MNRRNSHKQILTRVLALCSLVIFSLTGIGAAQGKKETKSFGYAGVDKCRMCHQKQHKSWTGTKHANAYKTLSTDKAKQYAKDPLSDENCLSCHTTGFGKKGGYILTDKPAKEQGENNKKMEGVQCEECHGPGEEYKTMKIMKDKTQAVQKGLVDPTEETCKKCHNEKFPGFDPKGWKYEERKEKVKH